MTRNKNRHRPTYTRTGAPRRIRGDARLERLAAPQRDRLRHWLERENLTYAAVVVRVRAEFGLSIGKSALGVYYRRHFLAEHDDIAVTATAFLAALPKEDPAPLALHRAQALAFSALCRPQPAIATAARLLDVVHRAKKRALARQRLALAGRRSALRTALATRQLHQPAAPELRSPNSDLRTPISDLRTAPLAFRAIQGSSSLPSRPRRPPPRALARSLPRLRQSSVCLLQSHPPSPTPPTRASSLPSRPSGPSPPAKSPRNSP